MRAGTLVYLYKIDIAMEVGVADIGPCAPSFPPSVYFLVNISGKSPVWRWGRRAGLLVSDQCCRPSNGASINAGGMDGIKQDVRQADRGLSVSEKGGI